MERFDCMKEAIKQVLDQTVERRISALVEEYEKTDSARKRFRNLVEELAVQKEGNLCISYLRSSYITGSGLFQIAFYVEEPFIEAPTAWVFDDMGISQDKIVEDLKYLNEYLKERFIRISPGEVEEIRRSYMEALYQGCGVIFALLAQGWGREGVSVYFGEYMGDLEKL